MTFGHRAPRNGSRAHVVHMKRNSAPEFYGVVALAARAPATLALTKNVIQIPLNGPRGYYGHGYFSGI